MEWMFMPLKRYAEFSGRSRRVEFWMYQLGVCLIYLVLAILMMVVGFGAAGMSRDPASGLVGMLASMGIFMVVFMALGVSLFVPSLAVAVRRLHDTNRSGWWLLAPLAPCLLAITLLVMGAASQSSALIGIAIVVCVLAFAPAIALLVFYCLPGSSGPNRYGPDPTGPTGDLSQTFR